MLNNDENVVVAVDDNYTEDYDVNIDDGDVDHQMDDVGNCDKYDDIGGSDDDNEEDG